MFQSVTHPPSTPPGALARSAGIALLLHLAALAVVLMLSRPERKDALKRETALVFVAPGKVRAKPAGGAAPQPPRPPRSSGPRRLLRSPRAPATPHVPDEAPAADAANDPGAGEPSSSAAAPDASGGEAPPGREGADGAEQARFFGEGMTPPVAIEGDDVHYTREALEARVEGTVIVRCVVTSAGRTEGCRILKGIPLMNAAVLSSLQQRRYRPATFQGRPVSVQYVFTVRLRMGR